MKLMKIELEPIKMAWSGWELGMNYNGACHYRESAEHAEVLNIYIVTDIEII